MEKYYCTKCNKPSVRKGNAKELSAPCCDGVNPVLHKQGLSPKKPAVAVAAPAKQPEPVKFVAPAKAPAKVTKLDQPAGDVIVASAAPQPVAAAVSPANTTVPNTTESAAPTV